VITMPELISFRRPSPGIEVLGSPCVWLLAGWRGLLGAHAYATKGNPTEHDITHRSVDRPAEAPNPVGHEYSDRRVGPAETQTVSRIGPDLPPC
jgi:hypothetical protein